MRIAPDDETEERSLYRSVIGIEAAVEVGIPFSSPVVGKLQRQLEEYRKEYLALSDDDRKCCPIDEERIEGVIAMLGPR